MPIIKYLHLYYILLVLNIITIILSVVLKIGVLNVTPLSAQTCPGLALTLSLLKGGLGWGLWSLLAQMFL